MKEPINLAFCKSVESHLAHPKFKHVFSIVTEQRTYYLVADSESEMDNWVDKLCTACGFRRTDDDNSPGNVHVDSVTKVTCIKLKEGVNTILPQLQCSTGVGGIFG